MTWKAISLIRACDLLKFNVCIIEMPTISCNVWGTKKGFPIGKPFAFLACCRASRLMNVVL